MSVHHSFAHQRTTRLLSFDECGDRTERAGCPGPGALVVQIHRL